MMKLTKYLAHPAHHQLKLLLSVLFGMAILLAMHTVQAEPLKDPTQPPASLYSNPDAIGGPEVATGPVLQSVMIGPQYRAAIINGKKVLLGKKYEQATLIRLNEHEAELRNPDMTTQTLTMGYPIDKKMVSPVAVPRVIKSQTNKSSVKRSTTTE